MLVADLKLESTANCFSVDLAGTEIETSGGFFDYAQGVIPPSGLWRPGVSGSDLAGG